MSALEELKKAGKIRSIGASNCTVSDIEAYLAAGQLDAVQEEYSMVKTDLADTLVPVCLENNVSILSYSSLALGLLGGKIGPDRVFSGDDQRKDNPRFSQANREKVAALMEEITPIAETHNATLAQVVIAWTVQQAGITFALCGARNPEQARENAAAGRLKLLPSELSTIYKAVESHLINLDS